ncbi:MAG: hypothetical protein K2K92_08695 [Duncaniella sp.]|nr:hypothetical protein [Duncaniella sp.]
MKLRIAASLLTWICGLSAIHAANDVTINGGEGNVGENVEITVDLTTESADIAALEIHIPLPKGTVPVEGSCSKIGNRLPDHTVSADMKDNDYVIVIFNTSLTPVPTGTGTALSFKLNLGDNPGLFNLSPTVKMSNPSGNSIECSSHSGELTVKGARLELGTTKIDFGRVPVRSVQTREVTAANTGTTELHVTGIRTNMPGLSVSPSSMVISPGEIKTLVISYSPTESASFIDDRLTFESNSVGNARFISMTSVPFSVNELFTGNAQGASDSEVTVAISMNNMDPVAGVDITYNLPDGMEYVDGSITVSPRASGFTPEDFYNANRELRLLLFSTGNGSISDGEGEILTFRLRLTGSSGNYSLIPQKAILSNHEGKNILSDMTGGKISINSPFLHGDSELKLGDVPMSGDNIFVYKIRNTGKAELTVNKAVFSNDILTCNANFPIKVSVGESAEIPVIIMNPSFGPFSTVMDLYSNDPDNRMKSVGIYGNLYIPNDLILTADNVDDKYIVSATLVNEAEITALQMDIVTPPGVSTDESMFSFSSRAADHSFTLAQIASDRYRLVILSLKNTPFSGNDGVIFSLGFKGDLPTDNHLKIENIILSNPSGLNYTTPGSEVKIPTSGIRDIFLDSDRKIDIYSLDGTLVRKATSASEIRNLPAGIYIINGLKILIR